MARSSLTGWRPSAVPRRPGCPCVNRQVLAIHDRGDVLCGHVRGVLIERLDNVRAQIAELVTLETHLETLLAHARGGEPTEHDSAGVCWILETDPAGVPDVVEAAGSGPVGREGPLWLQPGAESRRAARPCVFRQLVCASNRCRVVLLSRMSDGGAASRQINYYLRT